MKTYFVTFQVSPTPDNEHYAIIEGGEAHCLIVENNPQSAFIKAKFFTEKDNWTIDAKETNPIEVNEENFLERDIGLELFRKAQKEKIAIAFVTWAKDESLITEPTLLEFSESRQFNLNAWLTKQKQLKQKSRCLHFDSGIKCNEIINAHSIQKSQSLSAIADNGKVYVVSADFSDFKNNEGIIYKKRGIEKEVSVFRGFCKLHDNELFEPIDNSLLAPTDQQIFLYAYRSICKELFAKQNVFDLTNSQITKIENTANRKLLEEHKTATEFGLNQLKNHKLLYDNVLKLNTYSDMNYVLFISKQKPCIAFSGLFYPDFDFMGKQLQDLGNRETDLELITMCSAPMDNDQWGFLFAWHKTSSNVCVDFMRSLATMVYDDVNKLSDFLFRLVLSNCENHAIAPQWWEKLSESDKEQISLRASSMADPMSIVTPDYLMKGLEGIVKWEFDDVIVHM